MAEHITAGYDVPNLSRYLDWMTVYVYGYTDTTDSPTTEATPSYDRNEDPLAKIVIINGFIKF